MPDILIGLIASYVIGSIPVSYLAGALKGVDVRRHGSGNVGATNVLRAAGKVPAIIALAADIGKGVVAVALLPSLFFSPEAPFGLNIFKALLALCVIAGHNWSIFLKFKGGKGVATTCGALIVLLPKAMAAGAAVFFITVLLSGYVSLGSILMSVSIPIAAAISGAELEFVILSIISCILISYRHKGNIKRLILGTENKVYKKR